MQRQTFARTKVTERKGHCIDTSLSSLALQMLERKSGETSREKIKVCFERRMTEREANGDGFRRIKDRQKNVMK